MADNIQDGQKTESAPALTEHYHKARKLYALSSGLLLLWELVGIELDPTPIESLKVKLLSPEAVPTVLFLLVFYFAFRFIIEWSQCDRHRRKFLASRVDYYAANVVGLVAVSIYAFQQASTIRFYDYLARFPIASQLPLILLNVVAGFLFTKNVLLQCGTFWTSPDKETRYELKLHTLRDKFVFVLLCLALMLSVVSICLTWWEGQGIAQMAVSLTFLLSAVSAIVWVFFFHTRYQLDLIVPASPQNLHVS